ncbi:MAG TPA: ThuA domain-containing protein [Tepidisphaeraceae bacterium]
MTTSRLIALVSVVLSFPVFIFAADKDRPAVRVLVWDEQQPAQEKAYDGKFLGETIAAYLSKNPALSVRSAAMLPKDQIDKRDDPELTEQSLDQTDVLIWWGHLRHRQVKWEVGDRIVDRIKANKLALIALHSAQGSTPFIRAMNARSIDDALKTLPEEQRKTAKLDLVYPNYRAIQRDTPLTPSVERINNPDGTVTLRIHLPHCVFPSWREAGEPTHVTTMHPEHAIAAGLPKTWDVLHDEMYDEPFHVPAPDLVVFEERWDKGEHHRGGMLWNLGAGKVFYFQPGHETFGVYKEALPLKVVENAAVWLGGQVSK